MDVNLLVQDVIATLIAFGSVAIVVRRVVGVWRPKKGESPCDACGSCAPAAREPEPAPQTLIPLSTLRRAPRQP